MIFKSGLMIFRVRKGNLLLLVFENEFDLNFNLMEGCFNKFGEKVFYGVFEIEICLYEICVVLIDWIVFVIF